MSMIVPSVCPLDCPDRCSLDVTVEGGRVRKVAGSHKNPFTAGYICGKVARFDRRVHGPERLMHPGFRVGPKGPGARFERVSWDEAIAEIARRFREILATSGPEALLPYWYGGSNGYVTGGGLDARLWAKLGTTRIERTLCATNAGAAVTRSYFDLPGSDPVDLGHARCAVLWGVNPHASGVHLVPYVKQVLDQGGELMIVDPRRTPFAGKAVLHLQPLPGTDVVVALAIAHVAFARGYADRGFLAGWTEDAAAFERHVADWTPARAAKVADVRAADIEAFAERYAAASPAMIRCGWGVERTRNGTDAIRAILSLPAVYGKFGVRGGGYAMSTSAGYRVDKAKITPPHAGRIVNMSHLGSILTELDPPIRAIYVYDCNPVTTVPDQERVIAGLSRPDLFVVVHEQVHDDTVDYADVVLPATTFLEHEELSRSYGGYGLQWATPAIPPVGESRSNHAVMQALAAALGLDDPALAVTPEDIAREVVAAVPAAPSDAWERLVAERFVKLPSLVQFVDVVPSRKVRLVGDDPPRYREPPVDAGHPWILISPASTRGISSTLFETLGPDEARVGIHPDDAAPLGLVDGAPARVWNSHGEVRIRAELDATLRPGVLMIPKGLWARSTQNGRTANALIPAHVDEHGAGACYNDARVTIAAIDQASEGS